MSPAATTRPVLDALHAPGAASVDAATRGVVAILPRGEAIRNFVHTGALDALGAELPVQVVSVVPSDEVLGDLAARFAHVHALEPLPEAYVVGLLRDLLDMAHGRQLWSAAAQERWRLRDAEARTPAQKAKRIGRKLLAFPFASAPGVHALERIERTASRVFSNSTSWADLYRRTRPALVFNGSHVHSRVAIPAVQAATWLGIPTATFLFSWDNLTSQGRIMPAYDHYLVWNEEIKAQLLELYPRVRDDQVWVTGTPQFDFHFQAENHWSREELCGRIGADPSRPFVLYSTGMAEHMPGEPRIVEQIADMLADMDDLGRPQLVCRVYPKDQTGRFDELKARRPDILFPAARWVASWLTPTVDDSRLLTNSVRHAAVGINVASTVSLELAMFDRPVINVGYNPPGMDDVRVPYARYYEFDHYRPLVERRCVELARSPEQMRAMLRTALARPETGSADRRAFIARMFGDTLDGRSAQRVAAVLARIARGERAHG